MAEKEIAEALFSIRKEVETREGSHPELKEGLERLLTKLEAKLESSEDGNHLHIVEDMKDALVHFEVEHPSITATINQLMVALANMGV